MAMRSLLERARERLRAARQEVAEWEAFVRKAEELEQGVQQRKATRLIDSLDALAAATPPVNGNGHHAPPPYRPGTMRAWVAEHINLSAVLGEETTRLWALWKQQHGRKASKASSALSMRDCVVRVRRDAGVVNAERPQRAKGYRRGPNGRPKKPPSHRMGPLASVVVRALQEHSTTTLDTVRERLTAQKLLKTPREVNIRPALILTKMHASGNVVYDRERGTVKRGPAFDDAVRRLPVQ